MPTPTSRQPVPGTTIFDGEQARKGYALNKMCYSFNDAANRRTSADGVSRRPMRSGSAAPSAALPRSTARAARLFSVPNIAFCSSLADLGFLSKTTMKELDELFETKPVRVFMLSS